MIRTRERTMQVPKTANEVAQTVGKWPGVAGFTSEGDVYCPECAVEMGIVGTEHYDCSTDEMPSNVGAVLSHEEWDYQPHCGNRECMKMIDVRVIFD